MNSEVLAYLLQSGICLAVFYVLYLTLLRQETCFQYNRIYLLVTSGLSFLVPFLELPSFTRMPVIPTLVPDLTPITIRVPIGDAAPSPDTGLPSGGTLLLVVYGIGCAFSLFRFLRQFILLQSFIQMHQQKGTKKEGILYLPTQGLLPTFSFFHCIFWDNTQSLSAEEQQRIFQHEQVHVQQGHSFDLVYLEILLTIFWFNPLLHLYRKALLATHEFLADALVVQTQDKTAYSLLLARQVLQKASFNLGHHFNQSLTLKRLKMLQQTQHRTPKFKFWLAFPVLGLLLVFLFSNKLVLEARANDDQRNHALQSPAFPGGEEELRQFIVNKLRYPAAASQNNIYGNVYVRASIDKTGRVKNFEVIQAPNPVLSQEALRTLQDMPEWRPGKVDGKTVPSQCFLAFSFRLDGFQNDLEAMEEEFRKEYLQMIDKEMTGLFEEALAKNNPIPHVMVKPIVVTGYGPVATK